MIKKMPSTETLIIPPPLLKTSAFDRKIDLEITLFSKFEYFKFVLITIIIIIIIAAFSVPADHRVKLE